MSEKRKAWLVIIITAILIAGGLATAAGWNPSPTPREKLERAYHER